ncbi:MAG: methyltransferase domain-containing protein [Desulfocapsaceae bacterium]|nr:methyltransferase domain-containing protein [Desulfocapsaceae bacterium]
MAAKTLIRFIMNSPIFLMYRINKTIREFCRAGFISTAISEGIYDVLSKGPASCEDIQKAIGADFNQEGLEAWLDLGVSLGELAKSREGYSIKSAFSKELLIPANDAWKAFFQARVEIFHDYIIKTPAYLKGKKQFEFNQSYGELFARSSRTVEPFLIDIVDRNIPQSGACNLLEVGCGSGIYIKRACDRNPDLTVTGIELQKEVADFARENAIIWQLGNRVDIQNIDVRNYKCEKPYNIISFYNLIYYFPVNERIDILRHIGSLLQPGGQLLLTTLCPENEPSIQLMNLWSSMTKGCGPLPSPDQVCDQLKAAGFDKIQVEKLMPGFFLFTATISNGK